MSYALPLLRFSSGSRGSFGIRGPLGFLKGVPPGQLTLIISVSEKKLTNTMTVQSANLLYERVCPSVTHSVTNVFCLQYLSNKRSQTILYRRQNVCKLFLVLFFCVLSHFKVVYMIFYLRFSGLKAFKVSRLTYMKHYTPLIVHLPVLSKRLFLSFGFAPTASLSLFIYAYVRKGSKFFKSVNIFLTLYNFT